MLGWLVGTSWWSGVLGAREGEEVFGPCFDRLEEDLA